MGLPEAETLVKPVEVYHFGGAEMPTCFPQAKAGFRGGGAFPPPRLLFDKIRKLRPGGRLPARSRDIRILRDPRELREIRILRELRELRIK